MRKILGVCLSAATLLATMAPAHAGWRNTRIDDGRGSAYHINTNITPAGYGIVHYWYKTTLAYPDEFGAKVYRFKMEGNCFANSNRTLESIIYGSRGEKLGHYVFDGQTRDREPTVFALNGSVADNILEMACSAR